MRMLPTIRTVATPDLACEGTRIAMLAALDVQVQAGVASWHNPCSDQVELHHASGEAWLLDGTGDRRLR